MGVSLKLQSPIKIETHDNIIIVSSRSIISVRRVFIYFFATCIEAFLYTRHTNGVGTTRRRKRID